MGRGQTAEVGTTRVAKSVTDGAYIAGQMDADGSIGLYNQSSKVAGKVYPSVIVRVTLYSQDKEMLNWVRELYGGTVTRGRGCYYWLLTGNYMPFLEEVLPFMRTKRKQAELVRDYKTWVREGGVRGTEPDKKFWFVEESKRLNGLMKEAFNG